MQSAEVVQAFYLPRPKQWALPGFSMVSICVALNPWADTSKYENKEASHDVHSVIGKKVNKGDFWYLASLGFSRVSLPKENINLPLNYCEVYQLKRSFRFVPCHFELIFLNLMMLMLMMQQLKWLYLFCGVWLACMFFLFLYGFFWVFYFLSIVPKCQIWWKILS